MPEGEIKIIDKFYGGQTRDDKSKIKGVASNVEELDIFSNADYIQPEQIMSSDTMPASTNIYAYTSDSADSVFGYGEETAGNKVRIVEVTTGGADNPGAFSTIFTSADTTNLAYIISPLQYFKTTEGTANWLYYLTKTSANVVKLFRVTVDGGSETEVGTLTGLDGSFDRCSMKVMFGELFITHGNFIAKVDKDGTFTQKAFTLPNDWEAIDLIPVSDVSIILARNINRLVNFSKGYWWDLTAIVQVDDSFDIPFGGPQWIENHKETIKICCAINGKARFYQMSGAFPGAVPIELPGLVLDSVAAETTNQAISPTKTVAKKDNILYFGLNKTDKTGIYAIGQLDNDKPTALILSKRFATSSYADHTPYSLYIQGPNYYASFSDGSQQHVRCETNNSPNRSSNATYETIWFDDDDPLTDKDMPFAYVSTYPLSASTSINMDVAKDYGAYDTSITRPDGTDMNTTNDVLGFWNTEIADAKVIKIRLQFTSSGTSSVKMTSLGMNIINDEAPATK